MNRDDFQIKQIDPSLYNADLAPLAPPDAQMGLVRDL